MNIDKARLIQDALVKQGYTVNVLSAPDRGHGTSVQVTVVELSYDTIDLRHLCDEAEKFDCHCYIGPVGHDAIRISEPDKTPAAVRSPRQHPR